MDSGKTPPAKNRALYAIIAVFVVLSIIYSFATNLKKGPDEPAHFIYVRSLATTFSPPPIARSETPTEDYESSHEAHQPPFYYAVMAAPYAVLNMLNVPTDTIWQVLRLLGILIGAAWVYAVYLLADEFFDHRRDYTLITTAFTALIPNAVYMSAVMSNEMLIALLFTLALLPILRYFKSGKLTNKTAALLGLATGLAILTKAQGLILIPIFLLTVLLVCRRDWRSSISHLKTAAIVLGAAALVSGWWFIHCYLVYGEAMPNSLYNPMFKGGTLDVLIYPFFSGDLRHIIRLSTAEFWGNFWTPFWLIQQSIRFPNYFGIILTITIIASIGLILKLRRRTEIDRRSLALLSLAPIAVYASWLRHIILVDRMANLQGRFLLCAAAVVGIWFILGFDALLPSPRAKKIGAVAGLVLMLMVNVAVIASTIAYYAI